MSAVPPAIHRHMFHLFMVFLLLVLCTHSTAVVFVTEFIIHNPHQTPDLLRPHVAELLFSFNVTSNFTLTLLP